MPVVPRRALKPCQCKWQKQANGGYGYDVRRWAGPPLFWKYINKAEDVESALRMVQTADVALIRCNGCGEELLREYPSDSRKGLRD